MAFLCFAGILLGAMGGAALMCEHQRRVERAWLDGYERGLSHQPFDAATAEAGVVPPAFAKINRAAEEDDHADDDA